MGQREGLVFAARPLQLAARLVAPPIGPADRLPLRPGADDPTVTVSVPDEPLQEHIQRQILRRINRKSLQLKPKQRAPSAQPRARQSVYSRPFCSHTPVSCCLHPLSPFQLIDLWQRTGSSLIRCERSQTIGSHASLFLPVREREAALSLH